MTIVSNLIMLCFFYKRWDKEIEYLRLTIQSINNLTPKPKFMVIW